ncbi:molybdenum cofactor guanylyltransferase [Sediminitomix flava]|uniref:Probable molybdenum cofactor guanylyltransferase n=1 Tax=Sediminitomix flava TaxID=379075 RepID=A0A315ZG81_SEDFL|nr:molybdenum cofactor guanylyltransferase [Sediminitomix flava]PWJ44332.1 molybdenum cofactor guanylyltransferase [Sediminitomix flava]
MKVLGVILAGGKSSRMGQDKGLLELGGKSFVELISEKLDEIGADEIVISTSHLAYTKFSFSLVPDLISDIGPIGGLYAVMKSKQADYYFFISCDSPMISVSILEKLLEQTKENGSATVCKIGDQLYPLVGCYHRSVFELIEKQIENKRYSLMKMLDVIRAKTLDLDANTSSTLLNCNTPEDYKRLKDEPINH